MAEQKRFYWIKLKNNFFDIDAIDWLMSQKHGCSYVVLYQKLCLLAANKEGRLFSEIGEMLIPYDAHKISRDTKFDIDTVVVALELFKKLGLIYEEENGTLLIPYVQEIIGSETIWAEKKREYRQRQIEDNVSDNVRQEIRDKSIEIKSIDNKDIDIEEDITFAYAKENGNTSERANYCPYEKIKALYHDICKSYPTIKGIDGERKKAVKARWTANPNLETFRELFTKCENSGFLKGNNDRNWKADFDFMMNASKFSRILEGKYDDHGEIAEQHGTFEKPVEKPKAKSAHSEEAIQEKERLTKSKYANL